MMTSTRGSMTVQARMTASAKSPESAGSSRLRRLNASVVEVQGIERIKRLGGEIVVTPEDVKAAIEWDRAAQARRLYEAAKLIHLRADGVYRRRTAGLTGVEV